MPRTHSGAQVVKKAQAAGGVAVKIEHAVYQSAKMFGRHFDEKDEVISHITRQSIDVMKVRVLMRLLAAGLAQPFPVDLPVPVQVRVRVQFTSRLICLQSTAIRFRN